jgi:DNA-directed RNA polymerase specialized sigma24 family protein
VGRAKPLASRKSSELLSPRQRILLTRLPAACALVLALQDCGLSAVEISRRLSLPKASIPTLLEISRARLVAMEDNGQARSPTTSPRTCGVTTCRS